VGTQHLVWRTDGRGNLVVEVNGYNVIVESGFTHCETRFVIWGGVYPVTWGIRTTTLAAMRAAEQVVATMPAKRSERRQSAAAN
jgi:hypothetical protein